MVAAQSLPGASHQLLMSIFDSCAGPCEAHLQAALVAILAGCQLHKNLIDDINAKLELERERWAWEDGDGHHARIAPSADVEGCSPSAGKADECEGLLPDPASQVGASAQGMHLAYAQNEQLGSELQGRVSGAASECESKHSGNVSSGAQHLHRVLSSGRDGPPFAAVSHRLHDTALSEGQQMNSEAPLPNAESTLENGSDAVRVASCEAAPIIIAAANGEVDILKGSREKGDSCDRPKRLSGHDLTATAASEGIEGRLGELRSNGAAQTHLGQQSQQEDGAPVVQQKRGREKERGDAACRAGQPCDGGSATTRRRRCPGLQFKCKK
jgi:hypothetical protein